MFSDVHAVPVPEAVLSEMECSCLAQATADGEALSAVVTLGHGVRLGHGVASEDFGIC